MRNPTADPRGDDVAGPGAETLRRAFFLDRDGVINKVRYLENVGDAPIVPRFLPPDEVRILPSVAAALRRIRDRGFLAVVVTNQGYIERGVITPAELDAVHVRINELLAAEGAALDAFYVCPHTAASRCECRKPGTLLFRRAAAELGIDLAESYMVGDRLSDIEAGRAAGCRESFLVRRGGWGERVLAELDRVPDFPVCDDLLDVVRTLFPVQESA